MWATLKIAPTRHEKAPHAIGMGGFFYAGPYFTVTVIGWAKIV